jgi:hypothetical protein
VGERHREVERWQASGLSARRYAAAHGMSETSLKRWAAAVEADGEQPAATFVRLQVSTPGVRHGLVIEVGRARVRVEPGFNGVLLREIVATLGAEAGP